MYVAFLNLTCSLRELPLLTIRRGSRGVRAPARDISNGWVEARKRAGLLPRPCTHTFRSTESAATTKYLSAYVPFNRIRSNHQVPERIRSIQQNPQQAPSLCTQTPRSAESAATTKPLRIRPVRQNPQQPPSLCAHTPRSAESAATTKPLRTYVRITEFAADASDFRG